MKEKPDDFARIKHILDAIHEIENYTNGLDYDMFVADSKTRFATIKQFEIIGEACYHLSDNLKSKYPEVPFEKITSLRHILVHEYYGINNQILWNILKTYLNEYKSAMTKILTGF